MNRHPGSNITVTGGGSWNAVESWEEIVQIADSNEWVVFTAQTYEDRTFCVRVRSSQIVAITEITPEMYVEQLRGLMERRAAQQSTVEMQDNVKAMAAKIAEIEDER